MSDLLAHIFMASRAGVLVQLVFQLWYTQITVFILALHFCFIPACTVYCSLVPKKYMYTNRVELAEQLFLSFGMGPTVYAFYICELRFLILLCGWVYKGSRRL